MQEMMHLLTAGATACTAHAEPGTKIPATDTKACLPAEEKLLPSLSFFHPTNGTAKPDPLTSESKADANTLTHRGTHTASGSCETMEGHTDTQMHSLTHCLPCVR